MMTVCQRCGEHGRAPQGTCPRCGGVALYADTWRGASGQELTMTPLVESRTPGLEGVQLKVEGSNPSGSFKDRVMRVLVEEAVRLGRPGAVVASSGNAAVAAATACARERMPLLVLVPDAVSPNAVAMARLRGGVVVRAGEGPAAVHGLAKELTARFGLANLASTFGAAGCEWACRGIGHEIVRQRNGESPRILSASISVGPVLIGAGHGVTEATGAVPGLIGAQATGCAPIARAYAEGADEVSPWTGPAQTRALAIADRLTGYAEEATYALTVIRRSGGAVAALSDEEMRAVRAELARFDGLDVELASCAAAAALMADPKRTGDAVCILTGNGVKETLSGDAAAPSEGALEGFAADTGGGTALLEEVEAWTRASQ